MRDLTQQLHRRLQALRQAGRGLRAAFGSRSRCHHGARGSGGDELLMIRRATRGGSWSGHMGFPGGRRDPEDHSNLSCALRETEEELGVDLSRWGAPLGELSDVNTGWRKDRPEMLVTPFIFSVSELPELTPNDEVDDVVWVPLHFLMDESNREPLEWEWKGQKMETDSYLYDCYRIWGLSLMMIDEMMGLLRPEVRLGRLESSGLVSGSQFSWPLRKLRVSSINSCTASGRSRLASTSTVSVTVPSR